MASLWKTVPVCGIDNDTFVKVRIEAVNAWCASAEATRTAARILHRRRLTVLAEDLVSEVKVNVIRAIHHRPDKFETFNVAAYCTTAMTNLVKRMLSRREGDVEIPTDGVDQSLANQAEPAQATVDVAAGPDVDWFCAAVEAHGDNPIHVSAALTFTYLSAFTDIPVDDAPWPKSGVPEDHRNAWPALWYATRNPSLFPDSARRRDPQARKRQRHLKRIDALRIQARLALASGSRP